jgi:hypothetical protein
VQVVEYKTETRTCTVPVTTYKCVPEVVNVCVPVACCN